jgi:hypothetical protein
VIVVVTLVRVVRGVKTKEDEKYLDIVRLQKLGKQGDVVLGQSWLLPAPTGAMERVGQRPAQL